MTSETERQFAPIPTDDLPWKYFTEKPRFGGRYRHLSLASIGEGYRVGVAIEELEPGRQSCPAHYHIFEEEHVYVLEGNVTARIGAETYEMGPGDYVCFPAGQQAGHCLVNSTDTSCRYVIIGENKPSEVVAYTDSGKVRVTPLGPSALFDADATLGYWDGEDTGLPQDEGSSALEPVQLVSTRAPKPPVSVREVEWNQEGDGGRFGGRSKHLTYAAVGEGYHVGVLIEAPYPGKRLAPRHYHMLEEEHALILEGEMTLLLGDQRHVMKPGDFASFPAGRKVGHSFMNTGSGPCSYLMIGEQNPAEVCVYPDSNKVMVRALRSEEDIFDMSASRHYWDGES